MNRTSSFFIACALSLCASPSYAQNPNSDAGEAATVLKSRRDVEAVRVRINGYDVRFDGQPPIEEGGRVLVPLRGVLEKLGAFVEYDPRQRSVTAVRGRTTIRLIVGETAALVNDRTIEMDAPARTVGGSVMVPLRFVSESLGAQVRYDEPARLVEISTGENTPTAPAVTNPNMVTGTVVATYPNLNPRRFVLRVPSIQDGDEAEERTIPLSPEASVVLRQASGVSDFEFSRVTRGDRVRVLLNPDGDAETVTVQADGGNNPLPTPRPPRPVPEDPLPTGTTRIVRGTILRIDRIGAVLYGVTLTSGKTIRVPRTVPVTYQGQRIAVSDLQNGDVVTMTQDIPTQRGTKITVSGVR